MRSLVAAALLFGAVYAHGDAPRLREPANGATLRGGSFAVLDWSASPVPADAKEWEAFLSVDGGGYYAFRITPHLDIARRTFTWLVPNVDTQNARILIRTGDEKHETPFAMPGSFRIVHDADAETMLPRPVAPKGAEAAREGEANVLSWAQGEVEIETALPAKQTSLEGHVAAEPAFEDLEPPLLHASIDLTLSLRGAVAPRLRPAFRARLRRIDLLLVCRRLNV